MVFYWAEAFRLQTTSGPATRRGKIKAEVVAADSGHGHSRITRGKRYPYWDYRSAGREIKREKGGKSGEESAWPGRPEPL